MRQSHRTMLLAAIASTVLLAAVIAVKAFFESNVDEDVVRASPPVGSPIPRDSSGRLRFPVPLRDDLTRASSLPHRSEPEAPSDAESPRVTRDIDEALEITTRSAIEGDPASPPVEAYSAPNRDWEPTADELADPELYQQREEEFTQRVWGYIKHAFNERIETVGKTIEQAEVTGDRSPDELEEAYEALEALTHYKNYLETGRDNPEDTFEKRQPPGGGGR